MPFLISCWALLENESPKCSTLNLQRINLGCCWLCRREGTFQCACYRDMLGVFAKFDCLSSLLITITTGWLAAAAFGWWFYNIIYLLLFSGGNEAFFHVNFIMIMVINALWHGIKFYLIFKANYDFNEHAQQFFLTSLIIFSFSWRKNQSMLWVLNPIHFWDFIFQCELRLL